MFTSKGTLKLIITFAAMLLAGVPVSAQQKPAVASGKPVLWEQVNIAERDLYWGPGGQATFPELKGAKFIGRNSGGNSLKYEIEDGAGRKWVVKVGRESQPEVAATRLLWGVGYKTEVDYMVKKLIIPKVGMYRDARFELRHKDVKRGEAWSWMNNPFMNSRELDGLKIMMALINNWDLKDENTIVLEHNGQLHYVVSDMGASFGKLADKSMSRAGRSVNDPQDFSKAGFVKGVNGGIVEFDYRGINENVVKGIKVENARWMADLLMQLSDKQIEDAFRAADYSPEEIQIYSQAVKARIAALDRATKDVTVAVIQ